MKIIVVVSEFPKITETFAAANVLHYLSQGHDARVFHLKAFRHHEIVHPEFEPVVATAFGFPWLTGASAAALTQALLRHPRRLSKCVYKMLWAFRTEPMRLLASLAIVPKALALGRYAADNGVQHIHAEFAGHPATAAWIASQIYGVPFSFSAHMHDIFVSQSLLAEKSEPARFVRTISNFNRTFLANVPGFRADKIAVIRCGVAPARFPDSDTAVPDPEDGFNIAFVGALLPRKGVDILLSALTRLTARADWHLAVVGGGPEAVHLQKIAADQLPGRVAFHGPATTDEVKSALIAAHVVVVPSIVGKDGRSEGIPVVLMEALAAARPVIASRLSGIPELVEDGVTGYLIEPGDVDALAAKIATVFDDFDHAKTLGRRGRQRVLEDYNIDRNAADLLAMIERCSQ